MSLIICVMLSDVKHLYLYLYHIAISEIQHDGGRNVAISPKRTNGVTDFDEI